MRAGATWENTTGLQSKRRAVVTPFKDSRIGSVSARTTAVGEAAAASAPQLVRAFALFEPSDHLPNRAARLGYQANHEDPQGSSEASRYCDCGYRKKEVDKQQGGTYTPRWNSAQSLRTLMVSGDPSVHRCSAATPKWRSTLLLDFGAIHARRWMVGADVSVLNNLRALFVCLTSSGTSSEGT